MGLTFATNPASRRRAGRHARQAERDEHVLRPADLNSDGVVGFAGYLHDPAAGPDGGMYLARHRWMDPAMGRWVTRDPAGYVDGGNLYQHTRSSPAVLRDPSGLNAEKEECHNDGDRRLVTVKTMIATRNMNPKTAQNIRNTLIITSLAEAYIVASGFSRVHGAAKDRLAAMKSTFDTVDKNTVSPNFVSIATARLRDQKEILLKKML